VSEARRCPVPGCGRALGTTRRGDPWAFCRAHWFALGLAEQRKLFTAFRSWQRCERAYLRAKAEGVANLKGHMDARAIAIREYLAVRDDCIRIVAPASQQMEVAL